MKQYEFIKQLRYLENSWLQENQDIYKNYLNYIWVKFLTLPKVLLYLNKYINDFSWNKFSPYEKAKFIQNIMNEHNINHWQLWNEWPDQEGRKRTELKDSLRKVLDNHDVDGFWFLMKYNILELEENVDKKPRKLSKQEKEEILKAAQEIVDVDDAGTSGSTGDNNFINELSQEIIDSEKLTIIDVRILKSENKILYTFIDKNFHKRFYLTPFEFKFYFDTRNNVTEKEYFENKNSDYMYPYEITEYKKYQQLRSKINENFKNQINLGASDEFY